MDAELIVVEGEDLNRKIPVPPHGKVLIGRHHTCEAILDDTNVSKFHSLIIYSPKGSGIVDLGSRNGTFINGRRVKKYALTFGDEIRIGTSVFKFVQSKDKHKDESFDDSELLKQTHADDNGVGTMQEFTLPGISNDPNIPASKLEGKSCEVCKTFVSHEDVALGRGVVMKKRYFCENHLPIGVETPAQIAQYKLLMPLGGGSVSNVFKAKHLFLKTIVALKLMHPKLASEQNIIERFFREARFGVRLDNPNIIKVLDAGKADGHYYMIMEHFQGRTLYDIGQESPFAISQVLQIARQLCRAVEHAHSWGVVHRDIKPSNVLINEVGEVKLTDLGAAKEWENPHSSELTQRGQFVGTLRYQPPEQIANASKVDQRADIYAIGTCLYYCLTGEPPFKGNVLAELLDNVLGGKYIPIEQKVPDIPNGLKRLIEDTLQREPDHRPQNMSEVMEYLNP